MKVIHKLTLKPIVIALSLLQSTTLTHASIGLASAAPWTNRFTGQGLTGDHQLGGFVDDMFPILGNADNLFYLDGAFAAAQQDAWLGGAGTGARLLRSIGDRQIIAGAFVFGEYGHTPNGAGAWYANPGFELMTNHQEFRVQGYIPLSKKVKGYSTVMASQLSQSTLNDTRRDQSQFAFASGHSLYDTSVELADSFGTGLDAEVGQYLPVALGGWLRAGFYHFDYDKSSSINGVEANLQLFTGKHASVIVQDNYDNQNKNTVMVGMQMTFGGPDFTQVQDLSNRMEEPIIRHIARPSYALITPIRHDYIPSGSTIPVSTGNWFFSRTTGTSQGGTISFANCTAENPCYDLTQDIADGIQLVQPAANLMFASGDYPLGTNSSITGSPQAVIMSDGQTVIGRTGPGGTLAQWNQIATGTNRPTINGALFWGDNDDGISPINASGTIENMQIINSNQLIPQSISGYDPAGTTAAAAIAVGATNNLSLNNSLINTTSTINSAQAIGIWSFNGAITANHTDITAHTNGQGVITTDNYNAIGVFGQNGLVSFTNGTINTSTTGNYALSYGAQVGTSNVVVSNAVIHASTIGDSAHSSGVFSAFSTSKNAVTVRSSTVTASSSGASATATGISAVSGDARVSNSRIDAAASGTNGIAYGVHVSAPSHTATISGSTIDAASTNTGSFAYGIASDIVTFTGSASSIKASGPNPSAITAATVNNPNNSKCTTNGNTVTCHA